MYNQAKPDFFFLPKVQTSPLMKYGDPEIDFFHLLDEIIFKTEFYESILFVSVSNENFMNLSTVRFPYSETSDKLKS